MFDFEFGLPAFLVSMMILLAWLSFFSVVFFG